MKLDRENLFRLAVWLKGLDGIGEVLAGLGLLVAGPVLLRGWVLALTLGEISEDPHDVIAVHLRHLAETLSAGGEVFVAAYLLAHGVIKIALALALLRRRAAAYPTALLVLGAFLAFQLWRFALGGSPLLLALSLFDVVVIVLVWREWRALAE